MDNVKMPFLPEDTLKTQRVEVYLNDLKERLKELRVQHDEVIQNSVDIIKEIDEVSSGLLLPHNSDISSTDNVTKIKKLIQEFETTRESNSTKTSVSIDSKVDIRKILQNFEKLNDSHVLKESLVLFKRAKESFEKIDTFLGTHLENVITKSVKGTKVDTAPLLTTVTATVAEVSNTKSNGCTLNSPQASTATINNIATNSNNNAIDSFVKLNNNSVPCSIPPKLEAAESQISNNSNSNLKDRINMFNSGKLKQTMSCNKPKDLTSSCYTSCCSSVTSMDVYQSTQNLCLHNLYNNESSTVNSLEIGYEGDNDDSEYDLFALKRKKNKITSANQ